MFCTHLNYLDILGAICQLYFNLLRFFLRADTCGRLTNRWMLRLWRHPVDGMIISRRDDAPARDEIIERDALRGQECCGRVRPSLRQNTDSSILWLSVPRCCNTWQHLAFFSCFSFLPNVSLLLWFLCALYVCFILFFVLSKDPLSQSTTCMFGMV